MVINEKLQTNKRCSFKKLCFFQLPGQRRLFSEWIQLAYMVLTEIEI